MARYAVRVHHNKTEDSARETTEYEIGDMDYETVEIQFRLLEAIGINLANLAASAERMADALEDIRPH